MTQVISRFGATTASMAQRLDRYAEITAALGIRPTWPTTACVLGRHPDLLRRQVERGAELALHGLVHGDHALLDRAQQYAAIARAREIFERHGVRPTGFRGPYLRYNESTIAVLRELGLRYHSSQAVSFPLRGGDPGNGRAGESYRLALELYGALDARRVAVTPRLRDGLVDIPVAVPDDEILIDRLGATRDARTAEWLHVLDLTHRRGDLFTLQLHPERIPELGEALRATLTEARRRQPSIYIATLDEIASWWLRRSHFSLTVTRIEEGRSSVRFYADRDATLISRGIERDAPWYGRDAVSRQAEFEVRSPRMPVVGVSRRSPLAVRHFLAEEGFPIEISEDQSAYGALVDADPATWTEAEVLAQIDAAPGPLVRTWRWPNAARSALAVTGDIDALTLFDFAVRSWETRAAAAGGGHS
jgi:peptidoglycan/xylan/chitin deacetylase (PgdA/CDA1 family)